jgi:hypothetical protein
MTLSPRLRIYHLLVATFAVALGLGLFAPAAQAFTFEGQTTVTGNSSANYNSPADSRFSSGSNNGQPTIKQGNTTLQFGGQRSFNQRFNADRLFDPLGRPGEDR